VNNYYFTFNVTSTNASPPQSGYCNIGWSDNARECGSNCVPWSTNAPAEWKACYSSLSTAWKPDGWGDFAFRLSPRFAIGNFEIEVEEKVIE
jgi:hypothetical protein